MLQQRVTWYDALKLKVVRHDSVTRQSDIVAARRGRGLKVHVIVIGC